MTDQVTVRGAWQEGVVHPVADAPTADAPFASAIVALGRAHPELVVLSADLSKYTDIAPFASTFPDRFFQVGMAEQNMMGIAGGLAKTGLFPVAVTYCVFAARRAGDQIQMALSTGSRPSVVAAFLPGITTPFRASHQGTDDLAIMRAIPGMTVIDPMDASDLSGALSAALRAAGPVYLRGLRSAVARILPEEPFEIGKVRLLRDGGDVALIGTGLGSQWAMEAAERLEVDGVESAVLHVPTLKPFDHEAVVSFASRFDAVVTVENHSIVGGLGSAVAEAIAEAGVGVRLVRKGVPDRWGEAGPLEFVRERLGLDASSIARAAREPREVVSR
ncbi:MAG: transketolase family protein [Actinomycetota bacterium]|jgi:transketolase|nr:transketolase family protein [Actinomycetota bacterium]